jgi:predicted Zn-dependent protease
MGQYRGCRGPAPAPWRARDGTSGLVPQLKPLLLCLLALSPCALAVPALPAPAEAAVVAQALDQTSRMDYEAAEQTLIRELPATAPARSYFAGLVCMNRFLDVGDTVALRRAEAYWEPLSPRGDPAPVFRKTDPEVLKLYRGLTGLQLSYAASLRGQRVRSTALALAARSRLEGHPAPEARASLQLIAYYQDRLFEKLPFVDKTEFDEKAFRRAAEGTPALRDMLKASLFWIHIDEGRFASAEAIVSDFLARYPENRLARQMRGVGLYRSGRLEEARTAYSALKAEYAALPVAPGTLPLGYYRAVGNLARIRAAQGDRAEAEALRADWRKAEKAGLMPWLPSVLRRDLARR